MTLNRKNANENKSTVNLLKVPLVKHQLGYAANYKTVTKKCLTKFSNAVNVIHWLFKVQASHKNYILSPCTVVCNIAYI